MPMLSVRSLALPMLALAVIVALAQAHGRSTTVASEPIPTVHRIIDCAAPAKTLEAACAVAEQAGATVLR